MHNMARKVAFALNLVAVLQLRRDHISVLNDGNMQLSTRTTVPRT